MIGRSPAFVRALERLEKIAACDATVLIEGETGTGKELVARAIHYQGLRREQAFIPVNCGALPDSLLENELFGHARGAYTDARSDQPGLVELAEGGSLFLDEIDALTPKAQITLLRFLQDQRYRPLGSQRERSANVRIIAASNRCLEALSVDGSFRLDLLYRLRLLHLQLPPLRERHGDAALLCSHFIDAASRRFGGPVRPLDADTLAWIDFHAWPGNVRELENLVFQAFLVCDGPSISIPRPAGLDAVEPGGIGGIGELSYRCAKDRAIAAFEAYFLTRAMQRASGNVSAAARLIGTERRHLGRLLKKHGIEH
ncbi:sigma 54-interacting transcriptional regulator [Montanilutibacter psychrotolerans]|uniref:Sigma-54-dependent Fis family transcriptional regulator n=1 Tax=Montanilutibacter psychrotolerans TaxID=1327343 RepID=A0A3M8SZQ8_9GAMM|nr:sigma 54-interacting transcriptional regulator [Lysobacter psychrotolerans]RNF86185.1 sigma-54-dependent Fis family transcriptional regulator [Lysobacter psychrotolerans]